jgi:hypothetical protein
VREGQSPTRPLTGRRTAAHRSEAPQATTISDRKTARLVGWLFLGTFIFSIPGYLLYGPLLDDPKSVIGAGHDTQITVGALLEIVTVICNIGTAIAVYPVARRYAPRARSATSPCASSRDDHRRRRYRRPRRRDPAPAVHRHRR